VSINISDLKKYILDVEITVDGKNLYKTPSLD
jgi:hypothetical protein